jgi:hypothetical protein
MTHKMFAGALLILSVFLLARHTAPAVAETCIWEGTAPACNGNCRPGYTLAKRDKEGDGKKCLTGTKAYCCKTSDIIIRGTAPLCNGKCNAGEETLGDSDYGPSGNKCETGHAAICRVSVN